MTFDLTGVIVAIIGGIFSVVTLIVGAWMNARMKDTAARTTLETAVGNALGAIQQATTAAITTGKPQVTIPGIKADLAPGVQYVLDHAGDEATRLGVTPSAIADKISARIGLGEIATNLAVASSPAPIIPDPLGPVPVVVSASVDPVPTIPPSPATPFSGSVFASGMVSAASRVPADALSPSGTIRGT